MAKYLVIVEVTKIVTEFREIEINGTDENIESKIELMIDRMQSSERLRGRAVESETIIESIDLHDYQELG